MNNNSYLNLGCGNTFHKDWHNVDFVSSSKHVQQYNLLKGIPCASESKTVVYHSHVLEHFTKSDAVHFIKECHRVLQPNGIIRIAIPDLEQIALNYIKYLNESIDGVTGAAQKYEWTMLEMYDQVVRNQSGGQMMNYIKDTSKQNDEFLLQRNGQEVRQLMSHLRNASENKTTPKDIANLGIIRLIKLALSYFKNMFLKLLLLKDYKYYSVGKFRMQGEIHQWMYDRYSLKKLLEECGFKQVQIKTAFDSNITDWDKYNELDVKNGTTRKPDSLFMEAIK
jgi:predicted SAM-dependent methyltransferase